MKNNNVLYKIWDVLYPFLLYYAVLMAFFFIAQIAIGKTTETYMYCQIIATVLTLPVMYFNFYRNQLKDVYTGKNKIFVIIVGVAALVLAGVGLNNVLLMSPLAVDSAAYNEANANFYGAAFIVQIIGSGILTPMLEELVFRGIIFGRLRRMMKPVAAVLVSALFFAVIHLNEVQFPYAFFVGIGLAVLVEMTKTVWASIIGHMAVNLMAIFGTKFGWFNCIMDKSAAAWAVSIVLIVVGIALMTVCVLREKRAK